MAININRPFDQRLVIWEGAAMSKEVLLLPGAAWNLYLPAEFAGANIQVYAYVKRDYEDVAVASTPIKDFKLYDNGTLAVVADQIHDLVSMNLFGLNRIKFESDLTETCVGELQLSS